MKTGVLLIVAVIVVALVLIVGAFALRQSRVTQDASQFAQLASTLCIQAQEGMSSCATFSSIIYQTPAAATGLPACATEYPAPLAQKFGECFSATMGYPATSAAVATQLLRDFDARQTQTASAYVATVSAQTNAIATINAFEDTYKRPVVHLCGGGSETTEARRCATAIYPVVIPENIAVLKTCAPSIPGIGVNATDADVQKYVKCLNDNGIAVQLPK